MTKIKRQICVINGEPVVLTTCTFKQTAKEKRAMRERLEKETMALLIGCGVNREISEIIGKGWII